MWNRNYIDHIEITAAESIGIEGRGPFYEHRRRAPRRYAEPCHGTAQLRCDGTRRSALKPTRSAAEKMKVCARNSAHSSGGYRAWSVWPRQRRRQARPLATARKIVSIPVRRPRPTPPSAWKSRIGAGQASRFYHARWQTPGKTRHRDHDPCSNNPLCSHLQRLPKAQGSRRHQGNNMISMRIQPDEGIALRFGAKLPRPQHEQSSSVNMNFSATLTPSASLLRQRL